MATKFLRSIDIFSKPYGLSFNKERKFNNYLGGIFAIVSYVFILSACGFFLYTFFARDSPTITNETIPTNRSERNLKISFSFIVEDYFGTYKPDALDYVSIQAYYNKIAYTLNSEGFYEGKREVSQLETHFCKREEFAEELEEAFTNNNLMYGVCSNYKQKISGYFDGLSVSYFSVRVNRCQNSTNHTCLKTSDQIDQYLENNTLQVSLYYEAINFNSKNFNKPITSFLNVDSFLLDNRVCKTVTYGFQDFSVYTDDGWFSQSLKETTDQQFDTKDNRFYNRFRPDDMCLVNYRFFVSPFNQAAYRVYMKFQSILAQMVAVMDIIIGIFTMLISPLYHKKMDEVIMKNVFFLQTDDLDKKAKIEVVLTTEAEEIKEEEIQKTTRCKSLKRKGTVKTVLNDRISGKGIHTDFGLRTRDFFLVSTFPCCATDKVKKEAKIIKELERWICEYTDVLEYAKLKREVDKLKTLFLNEQEIAVYNLIPKPQNPCRQTDLTYMTEKHRFLHDYARQKEELKKLKLSKISPGLLKMLDYSNI